MAGIVLGVLAAIAYLGLASDVDTGNPSLTSVYIGALAVFAFCWLVGFLLTRTLGIAAMLGMTGAAAAAGVCAFTGEFAYVPAFLLHAVVLLVVQHGLKSRLDEYERMANGRRLFG